MTRVAAEWGTLTCGTRLRRCRDTATILNFTVQTRRKPSTKEKPLISVTPPAWWPNARGFVFQKKNNYDEVTRRPLCYVDCALLIRKQD